MSAIPFKDTKWRNVGISCYITQYNYIHIIKSTVIESSLAKKISHSICSMLFAAVIGCQCNKILLQRYTKLLKSYKTITTVYLRSVEAQALYALGLSLPTYCFYRGHHSYVSLLYWSLPDQVDQRNTSGLKFWFLHQWEVEYSSLLSCKQFL